MTISVLRRPRHTQQPVPPARRASQAPAPTPHEARPHPVPRWVRTTGPDGRTRMEMRWSVPGAERRSTGVHAA
ncbi:hypothetical protein GCM10027194_36590 [Thalassiella azotivora]